MKKNNTSRQKIHVSCSTMGTVDMTILAILYPNFLFNLIFLKRNATDTLQIHDCQSITYRKSIMHRANAVHVYCKAEINGTHTLAWHHPWLMTDQQSQESAIIIMCVCACGREREREDLLFSRPAWDRSPFSSAHLSGRNRESEANSFLGAVSKLFILCAKCVYWNLSFFGASATLQTCKQQNNPNNVYS